VNGVAHDSPLLQVLVAPQTSATRRYVYDGRQLLCKVIDPESGATVIAYDLAGNITWTAEGSDLIGPTCNRDSVPAANRIHRHYDAADRLLGIDYPGTTADIVNTYEADGALSTVASAGSTWTYAYNPRRMLTGETLQFEGDTYDIDYFYNAYGHLSSMTYPDTAALSYLPNALGQPRQAGTYAAGISYYPNGAIKEFTYGNDVKHVMAQNTRKLPARSRSTKATAVLLDDEYLYDANGNVVDITDQADSMGTDTNTRGMSYDALDRLRVVVAPNLWGTSSYTYDALDNLRTATQGTRSFVYTYNTQNRLTTINNAQGQAQITLGYNAAGDVTSRNAASYTFDAAHRLLSIPTVADYVYDGHGRRIKEITYSKEGSATENGVYNHAGQKLYRKHGTTTTRFIYLAGSQIAAVTSGSPETVVYKHTDALGSVVADTGNTGLLRRYHYSPYGESLNVASGTIMNGLGYTGHDMDVETGLTYMQQRYYDPLIGRFLSVDPVTAYSKGDMRFFNRYVYAFNSPYTFRDLDGRETGAAYRAIYLADSGQSPAAQEAGPIGEIVGDTVISTAIDIAMGGPTGEGVAIFTGLRAARTADRLNDARQNIQQLEKSRKSFQDLIVEHKKKIEDYARNPDAHDNKGTLARAKTPEVRQKIIEGRIKALEKQLKKQEGELKKVESALKKVRQ
jgi:RHS repeat-associated protein